MSPNRRIVLNVVATYGRSLYALVCGLITARWVLMTLGEVDYGLIGVVGGIIGFISFLNGTMATAVSRFYAYAVGKASASQDKGNAINECRRWFNASVAMHTALPVVLMAIGWPLGEWAVREYLTIPQDRIAPCIWVFRFSCLSCFVGMVSVPYHAMYTAKQEIAELTIYGFVTTTVNVLFLCYMVSHPGDWLLRYAAWITILAIAPSLIISVRAMVKYKECRFVSRYLWDVGRFKSMMSYAGCRLMTSTSYLLSFQGMTILVNKMLGPVGNAAMSIGSNVRSHSVSLTTAIRSAMTPAITNATGAGDAARVNGLAMRTSVYSTLGILVFAIPLFIEVDEVLVLWLKTPPLGVAVLVRCFIVADVVDRLTLGHALSLLAHKEIGRYQFFEALFAFLPLPIAFILIKCFGGLMGVGLGFLAMYVMNDLVKLYFGRRLCGFSVRQWLGKVALPLAVTTALASFVGMIPYMMFNPSFVRVAITTAIVEAVLLPLVWFYVLDKSERTLFCSKLWLFMRGAR